MFDDKYLTTAFHTLPEQGQEELLHFLKYLLVKYGDRAQQFSEAEFENLLNDRAETALKNPESAKPWREVLAPYLPNN